MFETLNIIIDKFCKKMYNSGYKKRKKILFISFLHFKCKSRVFSSFYGLQRRKMNSLFLAPSIQKKALPYTNFSGSRTLCHQCYIFKLGADI